MFAERKDHLADRSVQLAVRQAVGCFADRPAVGLPGEMQSFDQTYDRALRLVAGMNSLGLGPSSRVAILASNGPWYFELYFAACEGGFVECPLNVRFTRDEQVRYLQRIQPEAVLTSSEYVPAARELRRGCQASSISSVSVRAMALREITNVCSRQLCPRRGPSEVPTKPS